MADPPPTFSTIAAELQVMILAKVFEGEEINVQYPYEVLRKLPYEKMRLQRPLSVFFVSKAFYNAAKIALFQTATFQHDEFYFGKGRKSRRLQATAPEAFGQFRRISGSVAFMEQFLAACKDDRWPYEDLRTVTIRRDPEHYIYYKVGFLEVQGNLKTFKALCDVLTEHKVIPRFLLHLYQNFAQKDSVQMWIVVEADRCLLREARYVPLAYYKESMTQLRNILGNKVSFPILEADSSHQINYKNTELEW